MGIELKNACVGALCALKIERERGRSGGLVHRGIMMRVINARSGVLDGDGGARGRLALLLLAVGGSEQREERRGARGQGREMHADGRRGVVCFWCFGGGGVNGGGRGAIFYLAGVGKAWVYYEIMEHFIANYNARIAQW